MQTFDKDTLKFHSISSRPGNFGATIYNSVFYSNSENAVYLPLCLPEEQSLSFPRVVNALNSLGVAGISVSMPYKRMAAQCSKPAANIRNVNTMVPHKDVFKSYNTDTKGFESACEDILKHQPVTHVAGHGCVAHSIGLVLHRYRAPFKMFSVRDGMDTDLEADWLINATPVGMTEVKDNLFTEQVVHRYKYVFDVVVTAPGKPTQLELITRKLNKRYIPGYLMSMHQLIQQYDLYALHHKMRRDNVPSLVKNKMREIGYEVPEI